MSITVYEPNRILLWGDLDGTIVNDVPAGAAITPGMLVEFYNVGGVQKLRPNSSATSVPTLLVAVENTMHNKGIDDAYEINDRVLARSLESGDIIYALIPSGQNIALGDYLQSNGDGKLKAATSAAASAGVAKFQCVHVAPGAVTKDTRVRVQII